MGIDLEPAADADEKSSEIVLAIFKPLQSSSIVLVLLVPDLSCLRKLADPYHFCLVSAVVTSEEIAEEEAAKALVSEHINPPPLSKPTTPPKSIEIEREREREREGKEAKWEKQVSYKKKSPQTRKKNGSLVHLLGQTHSHWFFLFLEERTIFKE